MKNVKLILNEVLKEIQPDKAYENEIFARLNDIIKKINQGQKDFKAKLGGSGAKGTWLKTFDADIFVLFDYSKYKGRGSELSDILESTLKKKFPKFIRMHGSRDYFQIKERDYNFEIVPILRINKASQAENITDVSPLHSSWVKKYKKLSGEIKLTKQFCKAAGVYGAESYIRGFSGYACEILTIHYNSFIRLLKGAAKWEIGKIIDVEDFYKGKDLFKIMNTSKLTSPLIVIDPVQKDRNASAALSREKFEIFKKCAAEFLKSPSRNFFIEKSMMSEFCRQKSGNKKIIIIRVSTLSGKIDVVGSKLLKSYEFICSELKKNNFKLLNSGWEWDKNGDAYFYFIFSGSSLSKTYEVTGPPSKMEEHARNFRKKHKKTFIRAGHLVGVERRKYLKPEQFLKYVLSLEFVRERTSSIGMRLVK